MKMLRKFVVFLTVLALTVSCFAMTAAATGEETVTAVEETLPVTPAEPEATEPEVTEPEVTEPEVTEPEVTEPEVTEPEVTEPEVTEPEVTEPEPTEPAPTEEAEIAPELNDTFPVVASGVCGDNLTWTLNNNRELTITGTGPMTNYTAESPAPWAGQTIDYIEVDYGVTSIGDYAFYGCGAEEITLTMTLKTIGKYALAENDMQLLIIPEGVTTIGDYAVSDSDALGEVALPSTLKTIGEYAFARCGLAYVEMPNSVTSMGKGAFYSCPYLAELYISAGLTSVAERAFQYCGDLEYVIVPASVTYFEPYAFSDCTSLSTAYYLGTEDQFYDISFGSGNGYLENANWYLATIAIEHPKDVITSEGMTVSFSVKASRPNCTYQWYYLEDGTDYWQKCTGASATKPTYTFTAFEHMFARTYSCEITDEYGGVAWSRDAVLYVYPAPHFTMEPRNASARNGQEVSVSVEATGEELSYAWYFTSNAADKTFSKSSVTGDTYTCEMNEDRDGRKVYCKITDAFGNSTESNVVVLTMEKTPLAITQQPQSVIAESGTTARVSVQAEGDGLTYTWYYAAKGSAKFTKSSITTSVYSTTMDADRDGRRVYCVVTDKYGTSVTSETATLRMKTSVAIRKQPVVTTAYMGGTAKITVDAVGDGLVCNWYVSQKGEELFRLVEGQNTLTYSMPMSAETDGARVYCVLADAYGNTATTDTVTVNARKTLTIVTQPESTSAAEGETASATVVADGDGLSYAWYFTSNKSDKTFSQSSAVTATYSAQMNESRDGRQVYCVITDAYGNTVKTNTVTLTVTYPDRTPLAIVTQPVSVKAAEGETARTTVVAQGDGLTYAWYFTSNAADKSFSKSSTVTATYSAQMNESRDGRQVYCVITDKYGNSVKTATVTLTVTYPDRTPLAIVTQPVSVAVAEGETASATVVAQGDGLQYAWYYTTGGTATKFYKSSTVTATYSAKMDPSRDGRKIYCVITDKYGNTVQTNTVTLTATYPDRIPLAITQQPEDVLVAFGETAKTTVVAQGNGLSYAWYFTSNAADTTFSKSSTTTAAYSAKMDESRDGRQVYCVITDRYGDSVTTDTVTLSMKPITPLVITQQPEDKLVFPDRIARTSVVAEGDGLTYTWYFTNNAADKTFSKSSITGDTYSCEMTDDRNGRQVYCVITDAYGNSVKSNTATLRKTKLVVYINHQPEDVEVPNGAKATTSVAATGDGLTYTWYFTSNAADTTFSKSSVTTSYYSTTMDASRDGRRVYCVVTDQYGNSEQTRIAVLTMTGSSSPTTKLEIINHPDSVTVAEGETATATVLAQGDGLTYTWYYTPNGTTDKFYKSSVTSATYSTVMDASRDGREVYCVVTDAYGNTAVTYTVTLRMQQRETEGSGKMGTVISDNGINIRSDAGTGNSIVGTYGNGARVEILETKTVSGTVWGRTVKGWISMDYVRLDT